MNNTQVVQIGFTALVGAKMIVAASDNEAVCRATETLREGFNLSQILGDMILRFERLRGALGEHSRSESALWHYPQRLISLQKWLESRTAQGRRQSSGQLQHGSTGYLGDGPQMGDLEAFATDQWFFQDWAGFQDGLLDPMPGVDFDVSWPQGFTNPEFE